MSEKIYIMFNFQIKLLLELGADCYYNNFFRTNKIAIFILNKYDQDDFL